MQNVVLVIVAIFIPFAIVFLSEVLDSQKKKSAFEKLVLSEEVLGTRKIFWVAVLGVGVLALFSGKNIALTQKLLAVIITLYCVVTLGRFFRRTLRYSEWYKSEFELAFLNKLTFSNRWFSATRLKIDRISKAWSSIWPEPTLNDEREFTEIFVRHIDEALSRGNYTLATQLAHSYKDNMEHREIFWVGQVILPASLRWNKKLAEGKRKWLERRRHRIAVQKLFSRIPHERLRKLSSKIVGSIYHEDRSFWEWDYFEHPTFSEVMKLLIRDDHGRYQLFEYFKDYIDRVEERLEQAEGQERKDELWGYVRTLWRTFCRTLFDNIGDYADALDLWENHFPDEWKVASENSENIVPRIMVEEFIIWADGRIFRGNNEEEDRELTSVICGLFPHQHGSLFRAFLAMLFTYDVRKAIRKEPNFSIHDNFVYVGPAGDMEGFEKILGERNESQKVETIEVILMYFGQHWHTTKVAQNDVSDEEVENWKAYTSGKRKEVINRVRKRRLEELLRKLEDAETEQICEELESGENRREDFSKLVELLLARVS